MLGWVVIATGDGVWLSRVTKQAWILLLKYCHTCHSSISLAAQMAFSMVYHILECSIPQLYYHRVCVVTCTPTIRYILYHRYTSSLNTQQLCNGRRRACKCLKYCHTCHSSISLAASLPLANTITLIMRLTHKNVRRAKKTFFDFECFLLLTLALLRYLTTR